MKKIIGVTMLFFILCFSVPLLANANEDSNFDTYGIKNYEVVSNQMEEVQPLVMDTFSSSISWLTLPYQLNVDLNKEWTVTFSGETVSLDKIAGIVIERNGVFIPVRIRLFPAANQAIVTPQENYLAGENYTVRAFLENGLRYKMSFTTKNINTLETSYGNTTGNTANHGLVAESNGWIYYTNSNDGNSLYKMKTDGTQKTKLTHHPSSRINVIGGWIYYRQYRSGSSLRKIRINGTEETQISSSDSYRVTATDDGWIYYSTHSESGSFYKVKSDGTNDTSLPYRFTDGSYQVVSNGAIYSSNYSTQKLTKYDLRTDTGFTLTNERVSHINIDQDWIYYIDRDTKHVYKMNTDGSNKQLISSDFTYSINVFNGWIYYINDVDQSIYKMKTDGTSKIQLIDSPANQINVINQWIYYKDPTNDKNYRMRLDGSSWQEVQ